MASSPPDNIHNDELRRSLEHLLQTDFSALHATIEQLQDQIQALETLTAPLPEDIQQIQELLRQTVAKSQELEQHIQLLQINLTNPRQVTDLVKHGLGLALSEEISETPGLYSEIISPIILPAIRNQIRNSRTEMIAALYPIIGQTITKAVSEAMQDLRRRIDASLQRSLNFRQRLYRFKNRISGVPAVDLILRDALAYKILHVFLIHRETGLLLQQVTNAQESQDSDMFSAMITAIGDFAHDALGSDEDLEEIQYGTSHILLRNGLYAYLAVVVEGVQPSGYASLMQHVVHLINLNYSDELQNFSGNMDRLHDFRGDLEVLLTPSSNDLGSIEPETSLSRGQKMALGWGALGALLLIALAVFGCVFTVRLMPVAFSSPTQTTVVLTATVPLPTATPTSTVTLTATPTATVTATATFTLTPTATLTAMPSPSPAATLQPLPTGRMLGDVWVRVKPERSSLFNPVVVLDNTPVEILAVYDIWVKISWKTEAGNEEGWVPVRWVEISGEVPSAITTPVK